MTEPKIHNILGVEIKCLTYNLYCNAHLNSYATIEEYYDSDELIGCNTDENSDIYQLQIYEHTPIGFWMITANTIDELISELKEIQ